MQTNVNDEAVHLRALAERNGLQVADIAAPVHRHIFLDGRRFHYVAWGEPGRPPILFLHGGNQSARTWDDICLVLKNRFYCIALDARGHGDSEWSYEGDYTPASQARDIVALTDHLGWAWFVIVGMSMGCLTAMHYAAANCERLAGLVAVDAGPFIELRGGAEIVDFVSANKSHATFEDFIAAAVKFNPKRRPEFLQHSLHYTVRQMADGTWRWRSDRRREFSVDEMVGIATELEVVLPQLLCPVLVVRGAESHVFTPDGLDRFVAALPDGRGVVIPDAGHAVQGDNPRALTQALEEFLSGLAQPFGARRRIPT